MSSNPGDTGQTVGFSFECVLIYILYIDLDGLSCNLSIYINYLFPNGQLTMTFMRKHPVRCITY